MSETVEGLTIQIESNASGAVTNLEMLNNSLEKLKATVSNSRALKTFSNNFQQMTDTINNSSLFSQANFESIRLLSQTLGRLGEVKIGTKVTKDMQKLNDVISQVSTEALSNLTTFTSAIGSLGQVTNFKISKTTINNLESLAEVAKKLDASSVKNLDAFTTALAKLSVLAETDTSSMKDLASSMKTFSSATKGATQRGKTFNTVLANVRTLTLAMARVTRFLQRATTRALGSYGDYVETLNLFKVALGETAQEELAFATQAQNLLGIDLTQWMKAQGVFNALASGFGVSADNAALMSRNLTQLAYDISSFYNIDVDDAIKKVQSGFAGQIRPVRDLGYDLSQARLEAVALANGIDKEVKSMTQGEKSQLRYIALMTQLTEVQGDLARTIDSPTNQLRVLNAQLEQMYRSIGLVLLPLLNKIIPYLNALFRVIKMIAEEVAALFGYTLPTIANEDWSKNVSLGAEDLEDDLEDATGAAQELKNTLASFDQINLITSSSGGSGSGNGSDMTSGFDLDLPSYDFLGEASANKAQAIADNWMKSLRPVIDVIKDIIKYTVDHIDMIRSMIVTIATVTIGKKLLGNILGMFSTADDHLDTLSKKLQGLSLLTIGIQFSYIGGKAFGSGDWLTGSITGVIGAAVSSIGGYMLAGYPGLAIGLTLSIVTFVKGIQDAHAEEFAKQCDDIFFAFREGRRTVEEFEKEWSDFTEEFFDPSFSEKVSALNVVKSDVETVAKSIQTLNANYISGVVNTELYVQNIGALFGDLEEAVKTHIEAISEFILGELHGAYGAYLRSLGINVDELEGTIKRSGDNITASVSRISSEAEYWNKQLELGNIDVDEHAKRIEGLTKELSQYIQISELGTEQTKSFLDTYGDGYGVNFDNWEQMIETVNNAQSSFDQAIDSLEEKRKTYIATYEELRLGAQTEADKQMYEQAINATNMLYDAQEEQLKTRYKGFLQELEDTGYVNWMDVYNTAGIEGAMVEWQRGMGAFDKAIEDAYTKSEIARDKNALSYASYVADLVAQDAKFVSNNITGWKSIFSFAGPGSRKLYNSVTDLREQQISMADKAFKMTTELYDKQQQEAQKSYEKQDAFAWEFNEKASYYVTTYGKHVSGIWAGVPDNVKDAVKQSIANMSPEDFQKRANAIKTSVGDELGDKMGYIKNKLKDTMAIASGELVSRDLQEKYRSNSNVLLNAMSNALVDPEGKIKKAIKSSFSGGESEMETIGKGLGLGIAKGMDSVNSDAENSVSKLTKRMGKPFNQFGSDLYTYMNTMTAGIVAIWNSIEISTGKATLSSKLKVPKWAMQGYASGGFPNSADFFYANENGVPEYVGTMGGKTAVANNQEITKGVSDAVYKAIKETGIANDVKKIANKNGNVVFAPSEQAGRVIQQSVNMYNQTGGRY